MKASFIAGFLALAASQATAQFTNQSAPFTLVLHSQNATINGSTLVPCHEGAAIEGLCYGSAVAGAPATQYNFNYSSASTPDPKIGVVGILTYELRGGNFNVSSPMELSYNPVSNVAVPLFTPGENSQEVAFDAANKLAIPGYLDDRQIASGSPYNPALYYRWYACTTNAGYTYQTLAWVMGDQRPENPTCQKVDVVRVFV
jgi:hypothetical protein